MKSYANQMSIGEIHMVRENGDTWVTLNWDRGNEVLGQLRIPYGDLSERQRLRKQLMNRGCLVPPSETEWQKEVERLRDEAAYRIRKDKGITYVTGRIGWGCDFEWFVLPDVTLGPGPRYLTDNYENVVEVKRSGTLKGWQSEVAIPAQCSSRFMLLISAAFAAPLLELMQWPSFGINLSGPSSIGKSSGLRGFWSVIGGGELRPHGVTKRALEQLAKGHNGLPLALDETGVLRSEDRSLNAREVTYQLFSGRSDSVDRHYRAATQEKAEEWKLIMASTSEGPIYSGRRKEGEHVRLIDVPPPEKAVSGLIDSLECSDSREAKKLAREVIDRMNKGAASHFGHALPLFIEEIAGDPNAAQASARIYYQKFRNWYAKEASTPLESRLLNEFAICYAAGRLAIEFEILQWREKSFRLAVRRCWTDTLKSIPDIKRDASILARAICNFLSNEADLIVRNNAPEEEDFKKHFGVIVEGSARNSATIVIPFQHLRSEYGKEPSFTTALSLLKREGILKADGKRKVYTEQLPHPDGSRKRYYCFRSSHVKRFCDLR